MFRLELLELTLKQQQQQQQQQTQNVLFIIGDGSGIVGTQEIPGKTGKFCLGVQNKIR